MAKNRYFIAVILRGEAFSEAEKIKSELDENFALRGALRSPAHITLHRPFEWKAEKEDRLISQLEEFDCGLTPFGLVLSGFSSFSKRVIFIDVGPSPELHDLHRHLRGFSIKRLGLLNEAEDERGFHPHVTVAFRDLRKNRFSEVYGWVTTKHYNHAFTVTGFSLLRLEEKWRELRFFPLRDNI